MSKHTPGPYSYHFGTGHIYTGSQDKWALVANIETIKTVNTVIGTLRWSGGAISNEEERANGYLFAAAPDLLEAAEAALAAFKHLKLHIGIDMLAEGKLEEAIKKAKGE